MEAKWFNSLDTNSRAISSPVIWWTSFSVETSFCGTLSILLNSWKKSLNNILFSSLNTQISISPIQNVAKCVFLFNMKSYIGSFLVYFDINLKLLLKKSTNKIFRIHKIECSMSFPINDFNPGSFNVGIHFLCHILLQKNI